MADRTQVPEHPDAPLTARISGLVVRTLNEHTGRGPTRATTTIAGDLVVTVVRDALTTGERTLVTGGGADMVLAMRQAFQRSMREDLVGGVEELTGRSVEAFLSDNHIDPDLGIEMFILAPQAGS